MAGLEQLVQRGFQLLPEFLRSGLTNGWINESGVLNRTLEPYRDAPRFEVSKAEGKKEIKSVLLGENDGYYFTSFPADRQLNLNFAVSEISRNGDLIETKDGIGFYRLTGYLVFSQTTAAVFLPDRVRAVMLDNPTGQIRTTLMAFSTCPEFTLQTQGLEDPRAFANSTLYLRDYKNPRAKFVVKFLPSSQTP